MHNDLASSIDMASLGAQQLAFGKALFDPSLPVPDGVLSCVEQGTTRRFNVYRNNVIAGQIATLADAYPAVERLVGDEFFTAMAREFVIGHRPSAPMMFDYGADFAQFIEDFPPTESLPYLADVARIERAWIESYHALDADALAPTALQNVPTDDLRFVGFQIHPSARVVRSKFPACSIWKMNTGRDELRPISLDDGAEDVLIVRPAYDVHVHVLTGGGATFFGCLAEGLSIVDAAEKAFEVEATFDLISNMTLLFDAQMVVDIFSTRYNRLPFSAY